MLKKITLLAVTALMLVCFFATNALAEDAYEYLPDDEGCYTVDFSGTASNEYIIIVLRGVYDETNFVEAYKSASDDEILYYEQLASDEDGNVVFGPFVPTAYYDSTIIIGGTDLTQPVLLGYLRAAGASNVAGVEIGGVEDTYTVKGLGSNDVVIEVDAVLLDFFGYPAITDEKAIISVSEGTEGVTVDVIDGTVTVDKCAEEMQFTITAVYGEYSDSVDVEIVREEAKAHSVLAYSSQETKNPVSECNLELVEGQESVSLVLHSQVLDQYNDPMEEKITAYIDGVENNSADTFEFAISGIYTLKFESESDENVYTLVTVNVMTVPAYGANALALHNLIKSCEEELDFIGVTKFVSDNGKDVYPDKLWTTSAKKAEFDEKISIAKAALEQLNNGEIEDAALASYVTSLDNAKNSYLNSFKAGLRIDIESISIEQQNIRIPVTNAKVALKATVSPYANTDTITWKSSDPETVYIDADGNMTAKENGTVIISATTRTGLTATTSVTAYTKATRIQLAESSVSLVYGDEPYVLKLSVLPESQSELLTWTSSKPDIATVDNSGRIVAQPKAGKTIIMVVGEHGLAAECEVKVTLPDWETVSAPVATVASGDVFRGTKVELSTSTDGAKIYYTLDGSNPTVQSRPYSEPIAINTDVTLKAIAVGSKMFDSEVVTYEYTVIQPKLSIGEAFVPKKNSASVDVTFDNNPGVNSLSVYLEVPAGVTVTGEAGSALAALDFSCTLQDDGRYLLSWNGDADDGTEGVIASLTFTASETSVSGEYVLGFEDVTAENAEGMPVELKLANGKIKVSDVKLGDVNNDEFVDIRDVILLAQYCADWPSAVETANIAASNVNGDEIVDIRDVVRLAQHIASNGAVELS